MYFQSNTLLMMYLTSSGICVSEHKKLTLLIFNASGLARQAALKIHQNYDTKYIRFIKQYKSVLNGLESY